MKTPLVLLFAIAALTVSAQTNSAHNWTLKSGSVVPGVYFTSGSQVVVIKSHGTNCLLKISELSTNDWLYFQDCKAAQRQRQLDAEAAQMKQAGMMELTISLIEGRTRQYIHEHGWLDVNFWKLDALPRRVEAGSNDELDLPGYHYMQFSITDNGKDYFSGCSVSEDYAASLLQVAKGLQRGDRIRLTGYIDAPNDDATFMVESIEIIETAADAAAVKRVKDDLASQ